MKVSAIVLAAGSGTRLKSKIPKALVCISAQPIISYSLITLQRHPYVKDIVVVGNVSNKEKIKRLIKHCRLDKVRQIVIGGRRRQDSVFNGIRALDERTDLVLIHDAARPFVDRQSISAVIARAEKSGAAIVGVPVKATIKKVASRQSPVARQFFVEETLDRSNLWEIQTPQVFKKGLILKAYKKFGRTDVTDDAMLLEKLKVKVSVVLGSYSNIKITTPEDLVIAEALLNRRLRI